MNNWTSPRPSMIDLGKKSKVALLAGCGGGGDIMNTIPVMNLLKKLGVEKFVLADIGCKWWEFNGEMALGGEVIDLDWLQPSERLSENVAIISKETKVVGGHGKGEYLHESLMKNVLEDTVIATISIRKGVPGIMQGFRDLIAEYGADLFVTVDIGADAFFTGTETQVQSPLIDAISILCASELEIPGVYGVNAIGGDAEMPMAHIVRNIGIAMQKGAFIGGNGLTQEDINTYGEILKWIPGEEVEKWPYEAAQGHFGTFYCKRLWSVEMTPAAAFTFFFDPDILREVNPIVNAIKDTNTGGAISCRVVQKPCEKEDWCNMIITITDNGIGMSEEFQKHIFEAFERERNSTASHIEGSGIGMGITKKLVELMNGTIEVKSKQGEGSSFTVTVPCRKALKEDILEKKNTNLHNKNCLNGVRILLVEDNEINTEIARELLTEEGCIVETANDGVACIDMVEKAEADYYKMILMDIQMPVMNGYDATLAIRKMKDTKKARIPIVAMTANAFAEDIQKVLSVGMNDHVAKPVDMNILVPTMMKYL